MKKEFKTGLGYCRAQVVQGSYNKESGTFDITFATETPVLRSRWGDFYNEILLCDPKNVRMDRVNAGLPLLNAHPGFDSRVLPEDVMGKISNVRFEKRTMVGTVTLGAQCTDQTRADLESGILDTFSVGYMVYGGTREENLDTKIDTIKMNDWEPNHVAIAPIPADINSKMRGAENENTIIIDYLPKKNEMTLDEIRALGSEQKTRIEGILTITRAAKLDDSKAIEFYESKKTLDEIRSAIPVQEPVTEPVKTVESVRGSGTKEEITRLDAILLSTRAAKLDDSKAIDFFKSEKSIEEIRQAILEDFAKKDPKVTSVIGGAEAIDKKTRAAEVILLNRIDPKVFKDDKNEGGEFRGMTLMEIGKELLTERGVNVRGKSKDEVARMILSSRDLSTSDFPKLLEAVANKALRADYQYAPEVWNLVSRQTSVSDFKAKNLYQVGSENGMKETAEGGEIKYGKLEESKRSLRVKSYAEGLLFTRQALINDDLSAFSNIPNKFVRDWDELRGDLVWGQIISNVTMFDNKAFFHTDHKNLAGTGAVLSDTTLAAAILAMKTQTDITGKRKIRVVPRYLIVSPEYEITARKLLTTIVPNQTSNVNVFASMSLEIIVEYRLSGEAWYMTADPNATEGLYHAYLDGNEGLRSYREESFDVDATKLAVRADFGVAAIDFRGWYKNAGK